MRRSLFTVLCVLLALGLTDAQFQQFNCLQLGNDCQGFGSVCNKATQQCVCGNGLQGYDCGLLTAQINTGVCTKTCQNGGTCYFGPSDNLCYCPAEFWGDTCEKKRQVMESCGSGPGGIVISIKPTGTFSGIIYIAGEQNTPSCQFVFNAATDDYRITLTDGDCAAGRTVGNDPALGAISSYAVIVQYSQGMSTSVDDSHVFSCALNSLDTSLTLSSIQSGTIDSLDGLNIAVNNQGVNSRFTTAPERGPVPPMVYVGQELYLEFYTAPGSGATDLVLTACTANAPGAPAPVALVSSRCPAPENYGTITVSLTKDSNTNTILLRFKVFQFTGINEMSITCSVAACGPAPFLSPAICQTTGNCPANAGGLPNVGRRKREADIDGEASITISKNLLIVATPQEAEMLLKKSLNTKTESCLYSAAFISVTAVCGGLLLVALASLVLVYFLLRKSRKTEDLNQPIKG